MEATILNTKVVGLQNIINVMYYEGIEMATLKNGKSVFVYDNGSFEIL